ncbi:MAG: DUF2203 domain-containing protein [Acidimicrobiia bacterium]
MDRYFTLEEANGLVPEVVRRMEEVAAARHQFGEAIEAAAERARGDGHGGTESMEVGEELQGMLQRFHDEGIQVKGVSPALVDFPALVEGREVLLCWREGEEEIRFYHSPETGFAGRRSISELGE